MNSIRISIAQINPVVGDIKNNYKKITKLINKYVGKTDLLVFPEMSLIGYPPEDLVLREKFINETNLYFNTICNSCKKKNIAVIFGLPLRHDKGLGNAAAFIYKGKKNIIFKNTLPNYGVFDEKRVFYAGDKYKCIIYKNFRIGVLICEDLWNNKVPKQLKKDAADIFICINASPFDYEKEAQRTKVAEKLAKYSSKPLVYVNQVGGQDELVFDGNSFIMNNKGEIVENLLGWKEQIKTFSYHKKKNSFFIKKNNRKPFITLEYNTWNALVLGLRDYVNKNSFDKVILGLSGGIDSAVSAAIAVDALGNKKVHGILMPSKYSSKGSLKDAHETAKLLNIKTDVIKINSVHKNYLNMLKKHFNDKVEKLTEENLQSRIRGIYLMAYSNNFSYLLISTGNKSEMSVGYSTIYGDMNGGFNVLKDIYKTEVYRLAKWRNNFFFKEFNGPKGIVIPFNSIVKPPSAELSANQQDTDNLPDYKILDQILYLLNEKDLSIEEVVNKGHSKELVTKIRNMFIKSEYKRRQAPPGIKISIKSFGKERRYPITNIYTD